MPPTEHSPPPGVSRGNNRPENVEAAMSVKSPKTPHQQLPPFPTADMLPRNSIVRAAVAAVIVDGGKLLVGRRRGVRGAGQIAMPGGSIDPGETTLAAVEREVREETGLMVRALPYSRIQTPLFTIDHIGTPDHFVTLFVEARVVGGTLANREPDRCAGWEWLTLQQLAELTPHEAMLAWQAGESHEALCWVPFPHLSFYRDHLGL